jgi:hypothetical protein
MADLFRGHEIPKAEPPLPFDDTEQRRAEEERRVYDAVLEAAQASRELRAKVKDLIDGEEDLAELQARLLALAAESAVRTQGFRERGVYDFVGRYRGAEIVVNALQAGVDPAELFPTELFGVPPEAEVRVHEDVLRKTPDDVKDAIATMRAERDAIGELLRSLPKQAREQFESALAA